MGVSQSKRSRITAQDFYDFEKCPHRVYLNRHGDLAEKLPQSEFLNLLFENALTHEREVVKDWDYETPTGDSLEERAAMTIDLMSRGVGRIFQGVLLLASGSGIPDLLEKVPGKSKFGDFYYVPVDIKATFLYWRRSSLPSRRSLKPGVKRNPTPSMRNNLRRCV